MRLKDTDTRNASKLSKLILPFGVAFLCIVLITSFCLFHAARNTQATNDQMKDFKAVTNEIDSTFSSSLKIIRQLTSCRESLQFTKSQSFDPIITLNLYNVLSKSFNKTNTSDIYIGIYNPSLDIVVSNRDTSPLGFLLYRYSFQKDIFMQNGVFNLPEQELFLSDCGNYILYATQHNSLIESPISLVIFNINYIKEIFVPKDVAFNFDIILADTEVSAQGSHTIEQPSSFLPIVYTAVLHDIHANLSDYPLNILVLLGCLIVTLLVSFYFCWKNLPIFIQTYNDYLCEKEKIVLKEIIYGSRHVASKGSLLNNPFYMLIMLPREDVGKTLTKHMDSLSELENHLHTVCSLSSFESVVINHETYAFFITYNSRESLYEVLKPLSNPFGAYHLILTDQLSLKEVSLTFYKLTQLFQNNTILNNSNLLLAEDIKVKLPVSYSFTNEDSKMLAYYVNTQMKDSYLSLIDKILTENLLDKQLAPEFYKQFLTLIHNELTTLSPDYKDLKSIFKDIIFITNLEEVKETLYTLFVSYYDYATMTNPKNDIEVKFLNYIHQNYEKDISLADLSEHFNLAVNYVGVLFKEKTGHNFKDYLNTYRIKVAKEVLSTFPNIKIKDLSVKVGFVNINTFIRIFKKYEGISPGQYQKYLLDNEKQEDIGM